MAYPPHTSPLSRRKCDCCRQFTMRGIVHASSLAAMSIYSCRSCLQQECEPYGVCVGYAIGRAKGQRLQRTDFHFSELRILKVSLDIANKTWVEFRDDVLKAEREYLEHESAHWE